MNISIVELGSADRATVLPHLFAILYENMNPIAPLDVPFETARGEWVAIIADALQDARRTLLLLKDGEETIGFFMYAVNRESGLFLMEELQLDARYHGTGIFRQIYDTVLPSLPEEITEVMAYAHKNNLRSQGILAHLGLAVVGENKNGSSYRFCGHMVDLKKRFGF